MTVDQFVKMMGKAAKFGWGNQKEAAEKAGREFQALQAGNFDRAEDASGTPWKPHSPVTIAIHGPHPLLILSGDMKKAATGGAGSILKVKAGSKNTVAIIGISKTAIPYAWFHQVGTVKMPRRQFFYLSRTGKPVLARTFRKRVIEKVKKALGWR